MAVDFLYHGHFFCLPGNGIFGVQEKLFGKAIGGCLKIAWFGIGAKRPRYLARRIHIRYFED